MVAIFQKYNQIKILKNITLNTTGQNKTNQTYDKSTNIQTPFSKIWQKSEIQKKIRHMTIIQKSAKIQKKSQNLDINIIRIKFDLSDLWSIIWPTTYLSLFLWNDLTCYYHFKRTIWHVIIVSKGMIYHYCSQRNDSLSSFQ